MVKPISREDETNIPAFSSHKEAASFFKETYGADFVFEGSEMVGDIICYFYSLVSDHGAYRKGRKLLSQGQSVSGEFGMKFISSYQPVQIMENGNVHIVH